MNVKQVGGDHYAAEYQHWDLIEDAMSGYLEGCATKYVARWREKAGIQDLEKGRSYVLKLMERVRLHSRYDYGHASDAMLERFFQCNPKVGEAERVIIKMILQWQELWELNRSVELIDNLINDYKLAIQAALHPVA